MQTSFVKIQDQYINVRRSVEHFMVADDELFVSLSRDEYPLSHGMVYDESNVVKIVKKINATSFDVIDLEALLQNYAIEEYPDSLLYRQWRSSYYKIAI